MGTWSRDLECCKLGAFLSVEAKVAGSVPNARAAEVHMTDAGGTDESSADDNSSVYESVDEMEEDDPIAEVLDEFALLDGPASDDDEQEVQVRVV